LPSAGLAVCIFVSQAWARAWGQAWVSHFLLLYTSHFKLKLNFNSQFIPFKSPKWYSNNFNQLKSRKDHIYRQKSIIHKSSYTIHKFRVLTFLIQLNLLPTSKYLNPKSFYSQISSFNIIDTPEFDINQVCLNLINLTIPQLWLTILKIQ
jgi:hypothetical protein